MLKEKKIQQSNAYTARKQQALAEEKTNLCIVHGSSLLCWERLQGKAKETKFTLSTLLLDQKSYKKENINVAKHHGTSKTIVSAGSPSMDTSI